jgi:hypothetical protein
MALNEVLLVLCPPVEVAHDAILVASGIENALGAALCADDEDVVVRENVFSADFVLWKEDRARTDRDKSLSDADDVFVIFVDLLDGSAAQVGCFAAPVVRHCAELARVALDRHSERRLLDV